ncbi:ABC transporter permease [Cytobacillus kochii]
MLQKFIKSWSALLVLLLLITLWETAVMLFAIPPWLLPAPTSILSEAIAGWDSLTPHLLSTIQLTTIGLVIGTTIGIFTAITLHLVPFLKEAIYPLLILSQNIPIIVLAPLLVIWFGFGLLPKLIVITLVCFFPIVIATLNGFEHTPKNLKHYMLMAGASKWQLFWKLELPFSLSSLFSGIKISATYSVMGAVISEWLGAKNGLGVYMTLASSSFRTDRVFVAIIIIMIMSLILLGFIHLIESKLVRWHIKEKQI